MDVATATVGAVPANGSLEAPWCPEEPEIAWTEGRNVATLGVLAIIDVMVVAGNCLVVAAVFLSHKLRSVTNLFIVSLAVADLLVGVAVLPFSAAWEVFKVWIFGDVWCAVWLAVDVWMCTASILNLCAISLDRYVAVTRPVTYPSIMSPRRAKLLIAGVWVLSFVICFPPLVGWKDSHAGQPRPEPCPWTCELTNDTGYVLYSALGSFYLPMLVMLFFYWRIYRAAVRTTHAINQGFRTTRGAHSRFDDQRLTLRIHRGRGSLNSNHDPGQPSPSPSSAAGRSPSARRVKISVRGRRSEDLAFVYPSSDAICGGGAVAAAAPCPPHAQPPASPCGSPPPPGSPGNNSSTASTVKSSSFSASPPGSVARLCAAAAAGQQQHHLRVTGARLAAFRRNSSVRIRRRSSSDSGSGTAMLGPGAGSGGGGGGEHGGGGGGGGDKSPSPTYDDNGGGAAASGGGAALGAGGGSGRPKLISRMGKRNIKSQVKRFRMETKAAKTLGIIVGGFIVCWLPFFTMYVVRAFCTDAECIPAPVFSVLFWLGYCNSAINPCIYALFSRDFRFAFTRILCRCAGGGGGWGRRAASPGGAWAARRGSDGSTIGLRRSGARIERRHRSGSSGSRGRQVSGRGAGAAAGDDSDPNNDGSDSR